MIVRSIAKLTEILPVLSDHIQYAWGIEKSPMLDSLLQAFVSKHLSRLKNCKSCLVESPYVDKVYRDSYYHYYASKHTNYNRNSIRISLFDTDLDENDFYGEEADEKLAESYLGFIVLRPTQPQLLGRSTVHPRAIDTQILCCTAKVKATAGAKKLTAKGFPHSSQDSESISCAETTLWSLFEYYSSKYQEYRPILPSDIIRVLSKSSSVRQLPSAGLDIKKMAFAIKEFGFAPMLYGEKAFDQEFYRLISIYIESGIPLVTGLLSEDQTIGHAVLTIGRKKITNEEIDNLEPSLTERDFKYYDFHDIQPNFVFLDDNLPCYTEAPLSQPGINYYDDTWQSVRITHIIAPLYKKMYLEAEVAKYYFHQFIFETLEVQNKRKELLTRFYMASSRSYKHYLVTESGIERDLADLLTRIEMPKFIWIGELTTKEMLKNSEGTGLVILDATEANRGLTPLLFSAVENGALIKINGDDIKEFPLNLPPFRLFFNNLKV